MCPTCYKGFSGAKALSGGWLGAKKVFGCPHCRTFFTKFPFEFLGIAIGLLNVLFAGPYVILHRMALGEYGKALAGVLLLCLGLALVTRYSYIFRESVRGHEPVHEG